MNQKLTLSTTLLLLVPPLLWAGNAVMGRAVISIIPPFTLNFLRWALALVLLLPLGHQVLRRGSGLWTQWRRYALLGLLGVGLYNSLQYLALHTSTPVNVTLVTSSMPVWMLIIGRLFHGVAIRRAQMLGSALSLAGVAVVLSQGSWQHLLALRFVAGDLLMVLATICFSFYSWQLTRVDAGDSLRAHWAGFLTAQIAYGVVWSGMLAGIEWSVTDAHIEWSWTVVLAILYVAVGPAVLAFRCWGAGVQRVGPTTAGFFNNLTPLFAGTLSLFLLGEAPGLYHGLAFALIIGGIVLSSRPAA
ncbi:DMT family transporter [Castellaniella sp. S9]|uniref:DMT family transporter n=1 Tax=Castellaniella sp. S9 TaxID=2993652 RepID=UPI0022B50D34|nr:DMT family transporter [Castellaniella sp. S9]